MTVKVCYVETDEGEYFIQTPDDSQWGFALNSDDQSWPGGFGITTGFRYVLARDVPRSARERLGPLRDWAEVLYTGLLRPEQTRSAMPL